MNFVDLPLLVVVKALLSLCCVMFHININKYSVSVSVSVRWIGHVTRMPDEWLPKKVLFGELQKGKRSQGGQKKRNKDTLKALLQDFNIPTESWEQAAQSGVASSTKVPPNLKQREYVKLKGSVKKGNQEPRDHNQTQHSPNSLALFATDSLKLKLAYTAINEHTNTHKRLVFRI